MDPSSGQLFFNVLGNWRVGLTGNNGMLISSLNGGTFKGHITGFPFKSMGPNKIQTRGVG